MLFDRLLEDVLGFIRRFLWWRSTPDALISKPFTSMRTVEGLLGIIDLVEGRDTPRAVRSWIYAPKRLALNSTRIVAGQTPDDLHLYLDFLGPLPGAETPSAKQELMVRNAKRKQGVPVETHRLQILKASHFLNAEGFYNCELIFWQDIDFYLPTGLPPEKLAKTMVDKLAHACLDIAHPLDNTAEDWASLVQKLWQEVKDSALPVSR